MNDDGHLFLDTAILCQRTSTYGDREMPAIFKVSLMSSVEQTLRITALLRNTMYNVPTICFYSQFTFSKWNDIDIIKT